MKGEGSEAVLRIQAIARQILEQETVVLDVESTGLEVTDEVCEIAIVNHDGEVLLDTRVRPTCAMSPEAQRVHNIDPEALARAPSWVEIHAQVATTLSGRCWTSYGVEFDERVIQMSAAVHGLRDPLVHATTELCLRDLAAEMTGGYKSLDEVARLFGIEVEHLHRAKADAHLALAVLRAMAYG